MTPYRVYTILAVVFCLFVAGMLAVNPSYSDYLFEEDGIVELSGIAIASLSMILAFVLACGGYARKGVWKFWAGLSFLSFLFIGETLSWGERIFDLKMPRVAGVTFDAIHDLLAISIGVIKKTRDFIINIGISDPRSVTILLFSVIAVFFILYLSITAIRVHREVIAAFFKKNLKKPPFLFLFMALILILIAMIVDEDNLVGFPHKEAVDEGLELLAILGFLFSCICGFIGGKWGFPAIEKDTY